ncbi:hypothetical protein [Allohahella sp. A8]|uniref:hypothetical protein n=1 Tax=Allohahella sp. A8 TaxID=3141461 RepID=UPI003A8041BF
MNTNRSMTQGMTLLSLAICSTVALAAGEERNVAGRSSMIIDLPVSTQGPLWPPSEVTNKDGDFILVGNLLKEVQPGMFGMVPNQAVLVSKETVPPLDENGVEDPDDWFGAPHQVIRPLDLSKGSADLDMVLYATSFGPVEGSGGSPQIPKVGDSPYNLNKDLQVCPDVFPTDTQKVNYFRPSYPLHQVPVVGFQGDGVAYDPNTGDAYDPMTASNDPSCAATGCSGEDPMDARRTDPITLGEWLEADGKMRIKLTKRNAKRQYTHARFDFELRDMLPNSVYTVWVVRARQIPVPGVWKRRDIDPIAVPNLLVTDAKGRASASYEVANPFPDKATDATGQRIVGLSVVYHSDHQSWGACFSRFGPAVDAHVVFNTLNSEAAVPGTLPDMTNFTTVAP